jgi:hypothetical protein
LEVADYLITRVAGKPTSIPGFRADCFGPSGIHLGPAEDSILAQFPNHGASRRGLLSGIFGGITPASNGFFEKAVAGPTVDVHLDTCGMPPKILRG